MPIIYIFLFIFTISIPPVLETKVSIRKIMVGMTFKIFCLPFFCIWALNNPQDCEYDEFYFSDELVLNGTVDLKRLSVWDLANHRSFKSWQWSLLVAEEEVRDLMQNDLTLHYWLKDEEAMLQGIWWCLGS